MTSTGEEADPLGTLRRRRIFGLDFVDAESTKQVAQTLDQWIEIGQADSAIVITPNVDQLVRRHRRESAVAVDLHERATVVLPDGQPIVWASRLLGETLTARLPGSSLVARWWPSLTARKVPVLVMANSEEVADRVRASSQTAVAIVAPFISIDDHRAVDEFVQLCLDRALEHGPRVVFVTLGYPKQDVLLSALIDRWPVDSEPTIFAAVGASFDMLFGFKKRAPGWMQRFGLEWFYRFVQEPTRLFRRYFVDDPVFALLVFQEYRKRRR